MRFLRKAKPVTPLSVIFLLFLLILTLLNFNKIPGAGQIALRYSAVMAVVLAASYMRQKSPRSVLIKYVDFLMPLFVIAFTFDSMSHITAYINGPDKDPWLARVDAYLTGPVPGEWLEWMVRPAVTTVLQICYTSYYFVPLVFCLILFFKRETEYFDISLFGITLGFFVSFLGYIIVPALGPRYYLEGQYAHGIMRGGLASAIDSTLNLLEGTNRDAFPSGHTEVVLIVLMYAWRYKRWLFWLALPLATGLVIATMYLRYHYVVDVIAGAILAPVCVWAADKLYAGYCRYFKVTGFPL
ncbi:MAG: phosphatase PAP2 family protein [Nitrospirota bacterium]